MKPKRENFFDDVYAVVRQIPAGRVSSYGIIGAFLGSKQSARMVGWAMGAAHAMDDVPAHRVVNRVGYLSGCHCFATPTLMQERLEAEGITIKDLKIVDFKTVFWNPEIELL